MLDGIGVLALANMEFVKRIRANRESFDIGNSATSDIKPGCKLLEGDLQASSILIMK